MSFFGVSARSILISPIKTTHPTRIHLGRRIFFVRLDLKPMQTLHGSRIRFYSSGSNSTQGHSVEKALRLFQTKTNIRLESAVAHALGIEPVCIRSIEKSELFEGIRIRFKPSFLLQNPKFLDRVSLIFDREDIENITFASDYCIVIKIHGIENFVLFISNQSRTFNKYEEWNRTTVTHTLLEYAKRFLKK